ncbi:MAG: FtsX-like permease family protein [Rectinemataceae bacterium]
MNSGPSLFIATRSLLGRGSARRKASKPQDAAIKGERKLHGSGGGMAGAILGIGISLVPLILVLVVSDGMIEGITQRYMETKTYHMQVSAPDRMSASEAEAGLAAIESLPGVEAAYLEKNGGGIAVSAVATNAVVIRAVDPGYFADQGTERYLRVVEGQAIPEGRRDIVLGSSLASILRVKTGDSLTIITPSQGQEGSPEYGSDYSGIIPSGYTPKLSFFKVAGIVSAGYRDLDALWAFVSPEAGGRLLDYSSAYSFFGIKVTEPYSNSMGGLKARIGDALLPLYPDWFSPYLVRTWPEIERSLYRSFGTTKSMLLFIMAIALVVAALNLGSSLSTFVIEHSMDIAVLRSMGASDSLIRRIFVGAGSITGSVGTLLGLFLGLLISWNVNPLIQGLEWLANLVDGFVALISGQPSIPLKLLDPAYYLDTIPVSINFGQIALIAALSLALSLVVSLIPARKASRISVQELIRKS